MPKKNIKELPENYPVCIHSDCTRAATCLHQLAYKTLAESHDMLTLINPTRCTKDEECPHYRDSTPVSYARGFTNFQKRMYPDQYQEFMQILKLHFGRNPYFERRNGKVLLSPKEQSIVKNALKQAGVTQEMEFDDYESCINWCD